MIPPVLPVLAAVLVLELAEPSRFAIGTEVDRLLRSTDQATSGSVISSITHSAHRMSYVALVLLHCLFCLAAVVTAARWVRDAGPPLRRRVTCATVACVAIVLALFYAVADPDFAASRLTYFNILEAARFSPTSSDLVEITRLGVSRLALYVIVPTAFGIIAVLSMSGMASALARNVPSDRSDAAIELAERWHRLQLGLAATSLVLITSTAAAMRFFHLPVEAVANPAAKAALTEYATAVAGFWGAVFTVTMVATFVPAAVSIKVQARRLARDKGVTGADELGKWLQKHGLSFTPRKWIANAIGIVAPVLVAPIGAVLGTLVKAV